MNFHLKKAGHKKTVSNFSSDVKVMVLDFAIWVLGTILVSIEIYLITSCHLLVRIFSRFECVHLISASISMLDTSILRKEGTNTFSTHSCIVGV